MVKPFSPDEAAKAKVNSLPDEVIEIINEMLSAKFTGTGSVNLMQKDVIARIQSKMSIERQEIFNRGLLDFEPHYRANGWSVDYDRPAYYESYEPNWTFSRAKNG